MRRFYWIAVPAGLMVIAGLALLTRPPQPPAQPGAGTLPRDNRSDPGANPPRTHPSPVKAAAGTPHSFSPGQTAGVLPYTAAVPIAAPAILASGAPAQSAPVSNAPDFSDPAPAVVMENLRGVFRNYSSRFGGNPVGTNPEITGALNGGNAKQARFIRSEDGLRVNDQGELLDPWGMPFFFHQLSGTEMEIRSAGPDRIMWTGDDLVAK